MSADNDLTLVDIGILLAIIAAIVTAAGSAIRLFTWACGCSL